MPPNQHWDKKEKKKDFKSIQICVAQALVYKNVTNYMQNQPNASSFLLFKNDALTAKTVCGLFYFSFCDILERQSKLIYRICLAQFQKQGNSKCFTWLKGK